MNDQSERQETSTRDAARRLELRKKYAAEHLDIAAQERTFDGAYTRTSLNALATGILFYRVFFKEFAGVAITYVVFGFFLWLIAAWRRYIVQSQRWEAFHTARMQQKPLFGPSSVTRDGYGPTFTESRDDVEMNLRGESSLKSAPAAASASNNAPPMMSPSSTMESLVRRQEGRDIEVNGEQYVGSPVLTGKSLFTNRRSSSENSIQVELTDIPMLRLASAADLSLPSPKDLMAEVEHSMPTLRKTRSRQIIAAIVPPEAEARPLPKEYFEWREGLENPPVAPTFETSGGVVSVISIVTIVIEIAVAWQLLKITH